MIAAPPPGRPVTTPVPLTEAMDGVPLNQVPPVVASVRLMADPAHTVAGPLIDEGNGLTVISSFTVQPAPNE